MRQRLLIILIFTTLYTIIRYVLFGNVELIHIPAYVLNKSVSMASAIFLFIAAFNFRQANSKRVKYWGSSAYHGAIVHILLSFAILSKPYYPKFFTSEKMNFIGELTIMLGVLAAYFFWTTRNGKSNFISKPFLQVLAALFVAAHVFVMGFSGWIRISEWHGYMPPVSMISFVLAATSFILFLYHRKQDGNV